MPKIKKVIFEEEIVRGLIETWKTSKDVEAYHEIIGHCVELITVIINTYKFYACCPREDPVNDCIVKLPEFLRDYSPKQRAFSFLSVSIKNFLIKHTAKIKLRQQTQIPFSTLAAKRPYTNSASDAYETDSVGTDYEYCLDAADLSQDARLELQSALEDITVRFFDRTSQAILRYYLDMMEEESFDNNKVRVTRTASFMYDVSLSKAQFLYEYIQVRVRQQVLDSYLASATPLDMLTLPSAGSLVPELVKTIGVDNVMRVISVFGGLSITLPSLEQLDKIDRDIRIYKAVEADESEEHLNMLAMRYHMSPDTLRNIHRRVFKQLQALPRGETTVVKQDLSAHADGS